MENTRKLPIDNEIKTNVTVNQLNQYFENKNLFENFKPKNLTFKDFNPLSKPETSLTSIGISFIILAQYRKKYFLVNNFTLGFSSLVINYFCVFYIIENFRALWAHLAKINQIK